MTTNTKTVYAWWSQDDILNKGDINDLLEGGAQLSLEDCKENAISDGEQDVYIYKITVTRVLHGTQPPFTWKKE